MADLNNLIKLSLGRRIRQNIIYNLMFVAKNQFTICVFRIKINLFNRRKRRPRGIKWYRKQKALLFTDLKEY